MSTDPTAIRPLRRKAEPAPTSRWRLSRIPYSIRFGLPILVVVLIAREAWLAWPATRAHLRLVDTAGRPVEVSATAEFFAYDDGPAAPSPTRLLGTRDLDATGALTVDADLIGAAALVRLAVPGRGITYGFVEPGDDVCELELGAPATVRGVARDAEGRPVAGARVQAFGGGLRGVLLGETETGADGEFVFDGVSDSVRSWAFRVFANGFALGQLDWLSQPGEAVEVRLEPSPVGRGRLVLDPTAASAAPPPLADLLLRVYHLPGVTARTGADGTFEVQHLPPPPGRAFVLVPDLADGWTFRRTALQAGDDREILLMPSRVLRGRVVNGADNRGLAGAIVYHEHGPHGLETVVAGADGQFELGRVPLGTVEVFAHMTVDRRAFAGDADQRKGGSPSLQIQGSIRVLVRPDVEPELAVVSLMR